MRTIGQRYELRAEIASGGMATVHLARQIGAAGFARIVAVKRLHERYARAPDFVAMFLDEARLVARIRHPNVIQTIDVVAEPGDPELGQGGELFIVMEYVHGESLLRLLLATSREAATIPPKIAAAIVSGALHGLHDAHEARSETGEPLGIVHRDISPHNILVGVDGIARVLDFGIAKASERITSTLEGTLKGKLSYMAPEQIHSSRSDRRTDIYAASVVLWELLSGAKLFQGPTEGAIVEKILSEEEIEPPSTNNQSVPPALDAVVARGLAREPDARFATAHEMAVAIEQAITIATPAEVAAWVATTCPRELLAKSQIIATIESRSSSRNLKDAVESLRSVTSGGSGSSGGGSTVAPRRFLPSSNGAMTTSPPPPPPPPYGPPSAMHSFPPAAREVSFSESDGGGPAKRVAVGVSAGLFTFALAVGCALLYLASLRDPPPASFNSAVSIATTDAGEPTTATPTSALSCPEGMVMVPGGKFFMGSDDDLPAEKPAHNVTLRAFCMDRREVTSSAYRECSDRGDCKRAPQTNRWEGITAKDQKTFDPLCNISSSAGAAAGQNDKSSHPINCVDWSMADRFCRASGKRLPTEAEWEFAARGSDGRKFPWGDAPPTSKHLNACGGECVSWLKKHNAQTDGFLYSENDGFPTTAPVGSFPAGASRWGIEDLVGNVWEWVSDWYDAYTPDDRSDPNGPMDGKERVIRGGAWNGAYADWVRPTFRYQSHPDTRSHGIGFRCAKQL